MELCPQCGQPLDVGPIWLHCVTCARAYRRKSPPTVWCPHCKTDRPFTYQRDFGQGGTTRVCATCLREA